MTTSQAKVASRLKMDLGINKSEDLAVTLNVPLNMPIKDYQSFYTFYLTEHRDLNCRRLHFVGSTLGLFALSQAVFKKKKRYIAYGLLAGYTCAWIGHFGFEKNKPASFKQPLYSFISDWRMYYHIVTGQISLTDQKKDLFKH